MQRINLFKSPLFSSQECQINLILMGSQCFVFFKIWVSLHVFQAPPPGRRVLADPNPNGGMMHPLVYEYLWERWDLESIHMILLNKTVASAIQPPFFCCIKWNNGWVTLRLISVVRCMHMNNFSQGTKLYRLHL